MDSHRRPSTGTPLDPRLSRFFEVDFEGVVKFGIDSDKLFSRFQKRAAELDGVQPGPGPAEIREGGRPSQPGVIAMRAHAVFQVVFSAVVGKLIQQTIDLAFQNARTFFEEHPETNLDGRVTQDQLWDAVKALPPGERKAFIDGVGKSIRDVLMPNRRGRHSFDAAQFVQDWNERVTHYRENGESIRVAKAKVRDEIATRDNLTSRGVQERLTKARKRLGQAEKRPTR